MSHTQTIWCPLGERLMDILEVPGDATGARMVLNVNEAIRVEYTRLVDEEKLAAVVKSLEEAKVSPQGNSAGPS